MKTFYITTPIYYANSEPHLGHLYTTIVADVIQKYKRQRGFDTYFLTGTDEHGINIERAAAKNKRTPQEQVDFISDKLKQLFADFELDKAHGGYDIFMRTTNQFHYEGVQNLWRTIAENKTPKGNPAIYKGFYEGWFCAPCAEFKTEGQYLTRFSEEYILEIDALLDLIEISNLEEDIKKFLIERVSILKKGENRINLTKEEFLRDKELLPRRIVNNYNRHFDKNFVLPFFDILTRLKLEYKNENNTLMADLIAKVLINFEKAFEQTQFQEKLCLIHERPLDKISEESYFFRMTDYDEILLEKIENDPNLVRPEARKNEVVSFIKGGLQDLSISREKKSVSWGIPVPGDENHVMYVWLDALSNYITAIGYGNEERKFIGFEKYWQNVTHLVGKDILRFHTVYWFSFLMAAGIDLPKTVYAHGMWLDGEGRKMGKTLGNVIEPEILKKHFSVDEVRYFVLREMSFGQDGKFSYENLIERTTADLAKGLGNLSSRTLTMINKYRDDVIPDGTIHEANFIHAKRASVGNDEQELASVLELARDEFLRKFDNFDFSGALETLWRIIARIDGIISTSKPWELIKDENQTETLNAVLYRSTETLRWLCVLLYPVMPAATKEIYKQIGLSDDIATLDPKNLVWGELQAGNKIGETRPVFPRIDKNKVMSEIMENEQLKTENKEVVENSTVSSAAVDTANAVEEKPEEEFITIDDFFKVQLKVGEILVAEKVPNADKLLRFEIDLGEEKPRQILAGLAEYYEPEKLIGRKVVVVANLKPRKMRGLESQGMICAASLEGGDDLAPAMATFLEEVKNGARLK